MRLRLTGDNRHRYEIYFNGLLVLDVIEVLTGRFGWVKTYDRTGSNTVKRSGSVEVVELATGTVWRD